MVSEQVQHKLSCTSTEDGYRLEILNLESREIVLNRTEQNIPLLTLRLYNTTYEIMYTDHGQKDNTKGVVKTKVLISLCFHKCQMFVCSAQMMLNI